jgi:hypothetical protein
MKKFEVSDAVSATRDVYAGAREDGPMVCTKWSKGIVICVEPNEWDGVHVKLESNVLWWFKPSQLMRVAD